MSLLMLLAAGRLKRPKVKYTQTFTTSSAFLVPVGVSSIDLSGNGGAGAAGYYRSTPRTTRIVTTLYRRTGGVETVEENDSGWIGPGYSTGTNQCDPVVYYDTNASTVYSQSITCYYYKGGTSTYVAPTTGASATGFGKVFPGGTGGAASATAFAGVPVTAGTTYQIVVPAGGSVTITYEI